MENGPVTAKCKWNGGIADRRIAQIEEPRVPPDHSVMEWEVVQSVGPVIRLHLNPTELGE